MIRKVNKAHALRISLDVPSGFDVNSGKGFLYVKPDLVLTYHDTKPGLNHFNTKILDIGIPDKAKLCVGPGDLNEVLVERSSDSHKGDFGRILIIAGSEDYAGASVLVTKAASISASAISAYRTGLAALRAGADIITVAAPSSVGWLISKYLPDLIVRKFPCRHFSVEYIDDVLELAKSADVIVIGPGFGRDSDEFVRQFVVKASKLGKILVIDADALKALDFDVLRKLKSAILTPHAGEFELLFSKKLSSDIEKSKHTLKLLSKNAAKHNIILLKGNPDIIISKKNMKLNYTGNPAMTVGGTGDVLAGLCAGFVAQSKLQRAKIHGSSFNYANENINHLFNCACAAAFVNGLAGDKIAKTLGNGLIASDLLREIPKIINSFTALDTTLNSSGRK